MVPMSKGLPENAYRELKPGEKYIPIITGDVPEVTFRSVSFGILMAVIFSAAVTYIALKLGQGIESAIPIAILAVGFSALMKRKSTLLENVNILAIGATSGIVAGGSVFTMPAIYILGIEKLSSPFQIFFVPFLGAVLGVLFLIPFRRYFVAEMHGKLPFPEATATTEILMAGEKGGKDAVVLVYSMLIGMVYDFLAISVEAWREVFTTAKIGLFNFFTNRLKAVFTLDTTAAIAGLGYIIGVKYAAMIFSGSVLSTLILVPIFSHYHPQMSQQQLFLNYARYMGIGGIFMAGLISIWKMRKVIRDAIKVGFSQVKKKSKAVSSGEVPRYDRDLPMGTVLALLVLVLVVMFLYFNFSVLRGEAKAGWLSLAAVLLVCVMAFLVTSVSAWAIAMISVTPISGMTLTTLIVSAFVMMELGLHGSRGMLQILLIGGVVCTALSMAGSLITQFKIGYWVGATPKKIQIWNMLGAAVSSVVVTYVIILLAKVYGFSPPHPHPLPAPQPNAMAAVIKGMMGSAGLPWKLYLAGAVIAVVVEIFGISSLAFALGMYIPMELNSPILVGAIIAYLVKKKGSKAHNKGILIASGLIAGGALIGVVGALLKYIEEQTHRHIIPVVGNTGTLGNYLGLFMFALILSFIYFDSVRAKEK